MKYRIQNNGSRKEIVYNCPACKCELISDFMEAGASAECPECAECFEVPAFHELSKYLAQKKANEKKNRHSESSARQRQENEFDTGFKYNGNPIVINSGLDKNRGCAWVLAMFFAISLCFTVVGAVIGIPMIIYLLVFE